MADSADDLLAAARQALYDWTVADDRTEAEWNASARLNSAFEMLDHLMMAGDALPSAWKRPPVIATLDATPEVLAERDAEIARLTAELDATRNESVEYVITAGLEAAMAADPNREDGCLLRVTDGEREAYVWKAAAKTWEQVPVSEQPERDAYGNPPGVYDPSVQLTVWPTELEELDAIAARNGTMRDVVLRLFLKRGLEENR